MAHPKRFITFTSYVDSIRGDEEKMKIINEYMEKSNTTPDTPIEEHPFFKEQLAMYRFKWNLSVPKEVKWFPDDFDSDCKIDWIKRNLPQCEIDLEQKIPLNVNITPKDWDLFQKMVFASAKCTYQFRVKGPSSVGIGISSADMTETPTIDSLCYFQIIQLFHFFITEQIMQWLCGYDDDGAKMMQALHEVKYLKFKSGKKCVLETFKLFNNGE